MSKISQFFLYLLLIILSIFSAIFAFYYFEQNAYKGKLIISTDDLSGPIHIHTDENGFVHIKANNRKDAFSPLVSPMQEIDYLLWILLGDYTEGN